MGRTREAAGSNAVRRARQVVGLYGDPDVTWSILLEIDLAAPVAVDDVAVRLGTITAEHDHLGVVPSVRRFELGSGHDAVLDDFANTAYADQAPLLRVALASTGCTLLLAAHHGAVDGLGLVGLADRLLDRSLSTSALGVPRNGAEPGFVTGTLRRLGEALVRPPERFRASNPQPGTGDWLTVADLPARRFGTGTLVWVAAQALEEWNRGPTRGRQPVVAIGVSRRPGTAPLPPDRDTAYTRLRTRGLRSREAVVARLRATQPEPDFPESNGGGIGPAVVRLLGSRLGSSVLVSNLGVLDGEGITGARFWPTASGPNGVGIGLVTAGNRTALTVRARRGWFGRADAGRLLEVIRETAEVAADPAQ